MHCLANLTLPHPYTAYVLPEVASYLNDSLQSFTADAVEVADLVDLLSSPPYSDTETAIGEETVDGFFDGSHVAVPTLTGFYSMEMLEEQSLPVVPPVLDEGGQELGIDTLRHLRYRLLIAGMLGMPADGVPGLYRNSLWNGKVKELLFPYPYLSTCLVVFAELSEGRAQTMGGHKEAKFVQNGWVRAWIEKQGAGQYVLHIICRKRGSKLEGSE